MLNKKKLLKSLFATILSLFVCSCVPHDMGSFSDMEEYIDAFGDIDLLDKDLDSDGYDMGDFYYEELGEELEGVTGVDEYSYLFIQAGRDMDVEEMYLYIHGEEDSTSVYVNIELSTILSIPPNLRGYNDPDTKIVEDEDGNEHEETIEYDAIPAIAKSGVTVSSKWSNFGFKLKEKVHLDKDSYLSIKFVNNTFDGKKLGYDTCAFELTGLFIRAL